MPGEHKHITKSTTTTKAHDQCTRSQSVISTAINIKLVWSDLDCTKIEHNLCVRTAGSAVRNCNCCIRAFWWACCRCDCLCCFRNTKQMVIFDLVASCRSFVVVIVVVACFVLLVVVSWARARALISMLSAAFYCVRSRIIGLFTSTIWPAITVQLNWTTQNEDSKRFYLISVPIFYFIF